MTANADVKLLILTLLVASTSIGAVHSQTKPRTGEDSEAVSGKFRVCIDPGHPSENNDGGELTNGLREVSVNWEVALLLRRELESDGFTVVMTKKSESEFVTNKDRAEIANRAQAGLLLRLHADAGKASGFTVYYPRKQGTSRGITGPAADVLQTSRSAARAFHPAFAEALRGKLKDNGLRGDEETFIGGKQGALTGSIFSKVPTILVEMVFLTNPADADWIKEERNKVAMVKALVAGVRAVSEVGGRFSYFRKNFWVETLPTGTGVQVGGHKLSPLELVPIVTGTEIVIAGQMYPATVEP